MLIIDGFSDWFLNYNLIVNKGVNVKFEYDYLVFVGLWYLVVECIGSVLFLVDCYF